jgi:hypothetical protein
MTTTYVGLRRVEQNGHFEVVGEFQAPGAPAARRQACSQADKAGSYVAIPARSFEVEDLDIERESRVVKAKAKADDPSEAQTALPA